jgi:apolipoprotein N-acyltransferase
VKKRDLLLAVLSGALLIFSLPKFDLEFLAWVALIPLFHAIPVKSTYITFKLGFITGLVSFLGIIYWIIVAVHTYGNIPLIASACILLLLVGYLSLYTGAFAALTGFIQMRSRLPLVLVSPFVWVVLEYLRSFLLTGFPWANLGHSQYLNLAFIQMADITGVYGLSFVIVLVNAAIYSAISQRSKRAAPIRDVTLAAMLILVFLTYGYWRKSSVDHEISKQPALQIGLVQGNIDQSVKWDPSFQKETMAIYDRLSRKAAETKPDLIIWPETATPFYFQDAKEYQPLVLEVPQKTGSFLLFGTPSYKVEGKQVASYNSAYLVSPAGRITGVYDKVHLVPFGEYIPLSDLLFFIGSLGEGIGDFKSGKGVVNFSLPKGRFGVLICFEIIFPDLARRFVKDGANFLVTITNDAWFGRTSAPYQHFAIAVFRAVENRVFIARAANTGISGFIDPNGRILNQGGIFTEEAINGTIRLMNGKSFYTRYGDVFAWLCSGVSIILLSFAFLRDRRLSLDSPAEAQRRGLKKRLRR